MVGCFYKADPDFYAAEFRNVKTANLELNISFIPKYAEYMASKGVKGILVNGTTGEHVLLSREERKALAEGWLEVTRKQGQTLMVQVGGAALPDVLDMARHAEEIGVPGILCLPDLFFKPKSVKDLISYLKAVSQAAPKTPLFYYHIPSFTDVNLSMSEFLEKGKDELPTLSGIKFTSNDMDEGSKCLNIDKDYTVFLGADTIYSAALALGFDSGIMTTLNFWPEDFREITNLMKNGNVEGAKVTQTKICRKIEEILQGGNWVVQMKSHMVGVVGMPVGLSRLSLVQH